MKGNGNITYGRTSVYDVSYHLIWCTQYRNPLLNARIARALRHELVQISQCYGFSIEDLRIEHRACVDIFISAPPKWSITRLVAYLKGISARRILLRHPEFQDDEWRKSQKHFWSRRYYVETLGQVHPVEVAHYMDEALKKG